MGSYFDITIDMCNPELSVDCIRVGLLFRLVSAGQVFPADVVRLQTAASFLSIQSLPMVYPALRPFGGVRRTRVKLHRARAHLLVRRQLCLHKGVGSVPSALVSVRSHFALWLNVGFGLSRRFPTLVDAPFRLALRPNHFHFHHFCANQTARRGLCLYGILLPPLSLLGKELQHQIPIARNNPAPESTRNAPKKRRKRKSKRAFLRKLGLVSQAELGRRHSNGTIWQCVRRRYLHSGLVFNVSLAAQCVDSYC